MHYRIVVSRNIIREKKQTVNRLKKILKLLAQDKNTTLLVSSHDLVHTVDVCERIVALNKGEVVKDIQTSPETLHELEAFFAI